jgi:hypothetical protein
MSDVNTRAWIRESLVSLPAKAKNKSLIGRLQQFSQSAAKIKVAMSVSIDSAERLSVVFPDAEVSSLAPRVTIVRRKAKLALRDLTANLEVVSKPLFETKMIEMDETASGALKPVTDLWQRKVDEAVSPFISLAQAVSDLKLEGGDALHQHLKVLANAKDRLPINETEARAIKERIDALPSVVGTLGLTGEAGKFLVSVAAGNGNTVQLEHPEVRDFLTRYDLWRSIRISFGKAK